MLTGFCTHTMPTRSVCAHTGTVEQQIGHKLHCLVEDLKATSTHHQADGDGGAGGSGAAAGAAGPSGAAGAGGDQEGDGESQDGVDVDLDLEEALKAGERLEQVGPLCAAARLRAPACRCVWLKPTGAMRAWRIHSHTSAFQAATSG